MKRQFLIVAVGIVALLAAGFVGCGGDSGPQTSGPPIADSFDDGAPKLLPMQEECPVCGSTPIKQEFYVDRRSGRVYFNKQECVDKFKQNPDQYMKKIHEQERQMFPGAPPGGGG